jgi:hypothetical protein
MPTAGNFAKFVDGGGVSRPTISTPAITTQASNVSFVAGVLAPPSVIQTVRDNKGNTFNFNVTAGVYAPPLFEVLGYVSLNGAGGANHILSLDKTGGNDEAEVTLFFQEIRNSIALAGTSVGGVTVGEPTISPSITTTVVNALLYSVFGGNGFSSNYNQTPSSPFVRLDQETAPANVTAQGATASRIAATTGAYSVTWSSTPALDGGGAFLISFADNSPSALLMGQAWM